MAAQDKPAEPNARATHASAVYNYLLVTLAYWGFTVTDGALRVLVLLHFHTLGFSPLQIAWLFLLYEFFGIVTNLFGGWIASRVGLRVTLLAGLGLQVVALLLLAVTDPAWQIALSVAYVMGCQALSGIAKDLTKLSAKSAIKLVVPGGEQGRLFRWTAWLTGSKNALKGLGFFLGGALLVWPGFAGGLVALAAALALLLAAMLITLRTELGKAKRRIPFRAILSKSAGLNRVAAARVFLFAGRDIWFVVALPVFLYDQLGWSFMAVSGFLGGWIVAYGGLQTLAPKIVPVADQPARRRVRASIAWIFALAALPAAMTVALLAGAPATPIVMAGLAAFALLFAINAALHSYLVLTYTEADDATANVGFYYMANAVGRLIGTILSGLAVMVAGLPGALGGAAAILALAGLASLSLLGPAARPAA